MAKVLEMPMTAEQREAKAKEIIERLKAYGMRYYEIAPESRELIDEIEAGRAVTVGRLELLRGIEEKQLGQ